MKIRIMGTAEELAAAENYYKELRKESYINTDALLLDKK